MPTYEYKCNTCKYQFEVFQSILAEPVRHCPSCASMDVERLLTGGTGLIFKGSGFYITDYKGKKADTPAKPEKKEKTEKTESAKNGSKKED